MKMITLSPTVKISASEYAGQGNAILGIRDSGKSYSATYFAEQIQTASIPFIAFDPIGVWRHLKTPGTGPGFPVVVAGGDHGDLPLTVSSAVEIVRAAMHDNISLVLDLYTMEMSKADWRRIVSSCVRLLLYENKKCGLRHIFLEEAAEFCPQIVSGDYATVYSEIEKLARMGGNCSLGYTLINQRAEQLNKAVLELCDCLFLHRQKGRNSLTALSKWLHLGDSTKAKEIVQKMPSLAQGECYAWLPGAESPVFVKMPLKRTFHPDRRKPELTEKAMAKTVDVTAFVGQLQATLPKLAEQAKENDPAALKAEIAALRKTIKSTVRINIDPTQIADAHRRGHVDGVRDGWKKGWVAAMDSVHRHVQGDPPAMPDGSIAALFHEAVGPFFDAVGARSLARLSQPAKAVVPATLAIVTQGTQNGLKPTQRRILTIIAQRPGGSTSKQLAIFAGLAMSGSFMAYIHSLEAGGLIIKDGGAYQITSEGIKVLGHFVPLPVGRELLDYWIREKLKPTEAKVLIQIIDVFPGSIRSADIATNLGLAMSGSFMGYINHLVGLELVERVGSGTFKASPYLF